jgi:hypothetical protein
LVNVSRNCIRHLLVALRNLFIKLNEGKPLLGAGLIHSGILRPRKLPGVICRVCVRKSFSLSFTKINSLYPLAYWLSELRNACAKGLGRADVASVSKRLSAGHLVRTENLDRTVRMHSMARGIGWLARFSSNWRARAVCPQVSSNPLPGFGRLHVFLFIMHIETR